MTILKLWAPKAKRVDVRMNGEMYSMIPGSGGWWRLSVSDSEKEKDYSFFLDGNGPLPDPRSLRQPEGVHGFSRSYDHARFQWNDNTWRPPPLSAAVIYELHVGTFSHEGNFEGVANRLDYLADLGITHVELMPVNGFSGTRGWGYDGVNLYAPYEVYGGPDALKRLVDACHKQGLAVIQDVVYNHFGPEGNYLPRFGPYTTDRYRQPWGEAVNFDGPESDEVRRFICDNAAMWFRDYHMDGLRIDAVHSILDTSAVHILEELSRNVEDLQTELGRQLFLIAESALNNARIVKSRETGGYGLDAQWTDDLHHALHAVLTGEQKGYYADFGKIGHVAKAMKDVFVFDGVYSAYRRRTHGRPVGDVPGYRFVTFLQNHDQVGNRAGGDRLGHSVSPGLLKIGAALTILSPYVPLIFQGEEWNASSPFQYFTDHGDPELKQRVSEGRKEEFASFNWEKEEVPDPQDPRTFYRSKLNWEERTEEHHTSIFQWYRSLIRLRTSSPVFLDGRRDRIQTSFDEEERWIVLQRGPMTIAGNVSGRGRWIPLEKERPRHILVASTEKVKLKESKIFLPPESLAVVGPESCEI